MEFMKIFFSFILGFIITFIAMPRFIPFLTKLKFGQVEREEGPESHKIKGGTPTMGGIVFIAASVIAVYLTFPSYILDPTVGLITLMFVGYGLIGFIDDYLIVVKKTNLGLSAAKKYLMQSVLAVLFYVLALNFVPGFSTVITIPVIRTSVDIGFLYPVLVYFMFTATSNGVNLSDGLDGLATGLSMVAIAPFVIFGLMSKTYAISIYGMAVIGALLGFMMYNYHPAKIFMGDSGSLSLGGLLAVLAIFAKQELLLLLVGGVFVVETLSVIIQVTSFKLTGKRVFKMAPLHHHFELLGWAEQQVVISFWLGGFICGMVGIVLGVL
ncbi:phospho-N-acetylmuramoyl-pentapeptide-transferase [Beduini massiliensis]|uniref:phospho-N-acetylmuramoyl-pentapeptide- transferase n=1 Tax=Beduini massiliensis TaxID=1585974 RepID=UPI00059AA171|nr:phospho-N-acetylmuramoyl-pentapeptide-transferase [Beduini massiliensis]